MSSRASTIRGRVLDTSVTSHREPPLRRFGSFLTGCDLEVAPMLFDQIDGGHHSAVARQFSRPDPRTPARLRIGDSLYDRRPQLAHIHVARVEHAGREPFA